MIEFAVRKTIITPEQPVFMAGFGARTRKSEGVMDDLYVKTVLLKDQAGRHVLIIALDLLSGDRSFITGLKATLNEKFHLQPDEIIVNFSHTHAAIYVTGENPEGRRGIYSMGQDEWPEDATKIDFTEDVKYYHYLTGKIVDLVQECYANLEKGTLEYGTGTTKIAVSRRLMTPEGIRWAPNFDANIDDTLTVMKLVGEDGTLKSVLFSVGCHPTAIGSDNYLLSAEFPGQACNQLEEEYSDAVAVFLQGCAGDIKPTESADGERFKPCTEAEMRKVGDDLSAEVKHVINENEFRTVEASFTVKLIDLPIPTGEIPIGELELMIADEKTTDFYKRSAKRLLKAIDDGTSRNVVPMYVAVWQLDEQTKLIALEHEIPTEYSLMIKDKFGSDGTIVLGYSNSVYTYIPTRKISAEGGYEAEHYWSSKFRGPLSDQTQDLILNAIGEGLEQAR